MTVTINGTTGITTPTDTATTSVTTPLLTSPTATALTIQSAGTTAMTVDTSQNVGIGTTSPSSGNKLQVNGKIAIGTNNVGLVLTDASSNQFQALYCDSSSNLQISAGGSGSSMLFYNNAGNERMRIDSSGNLLVGTTSGFSSATKLYLYGDSTTNWMSVLKDVRSDGSVSAGIMGFYRGSTNVGGIQTSTSSTSYVTSSDYRLKENVQPMTTGLATIGALRPVTYDWKIDGSLGEGFIAHELAEVIPLAVTGEKDAVNEDGSIKPQGVDYSKIVVHLVAAMQELSAKNDALEARLAALEAK